jgi:hypothetical protein
VYQVWLKSLQAFQSYARTYTDIHKHQFLYIRVYIYIYIYRERERERERESGGARSSERHYSVGVEVILVEVRLVCGICSILIFKIIGTATMGQNVVCHWEVYIRAKF